MKTSTARTDKEGETAQTRSTDDPWTSVYNKDRKNAFVTDKIHRSSVDLVCMYNKEGHNQGGGISNMTTRTQYNNTQQTTLWGLQIFVPTKLGFDGVSINSCQNSFFVRAPIHSAKVFAHAKKVFLSHKISSWQPITCLKPHNRINSLT